MDNGTAAWGQVSDAASTWGDPEDSGKAPGWGAPSPNSNKPGKNGKKIVDIFLDDLDEVMFLFF